MDELRARYLASPEARPTSSARGVHHLALLSSDVERTIAFYQDLLEFPLTELFENRDYQGSTHFFFDIGNENLLARWCPSMAHGSRRTPRYSLELMRDDVLSALVELDLTNTCLVGHSLGGMLAYLAAEQQPAAIGRLVLEDTPPPLPAAPAREVPEKPDTDLPFDWDVIPALYAQRNDPDPQWWDSLASISIPTLLIAGGDTSHVDQQQLAHMAERISDCRTVTIQAGHNVHSNEPEAFVDAIAAFIGQ